MQETTDQEKLVYHLSELRKTLLNIIVCIIILFPLGYFLAPYITDFIVKWSFSYQNAQLNFFSPMEVFLINLKIGFVFSFVFVQQLLRKLFRVALINHRVSFCGFFFFRLFLGFHI